jgi:hypothetical protein
MMILTDHDHILPLSPAVVNPGMRLIPIWVMPALPPRGTVYTIEGRRLDYSPDAPLDNEVRFGMLAYGVMPLGAPLVRRDPAAGV